MEKTRIQQWQMGVEVLKLVLLGSDKSHNTSYNFHSKQEWKTPEVTQNN